MELEKRHKSTDYYLSQYVKLSDQLHAVANLPPVHISKNDMWAPMSVCIICRRSNSLATVGTRTTSPIIQSSHSTDIKHSSA